MPTARRNDLDRDAYLELVRTHEALSSQFLALFREHGLTQAQYNVLRIVLGGPVEGTPCQRIGEQLLNRVPDVTRLLDRMEAAGLVVRTRGTEDRRVVRVAATPAGRALCESLSTPVLDLHGRQLAALSRKETGELLRLLRKLRAGR